MIAQPSSFCFAPFGIKGLNDISGPSANGGQNCYYQHSQAGMVWFGGLRFIVWNKNSQYP